MSTPRRWPSMLRADRQTDEYLHHDGPSAACTEALAAAARKVACVMFGPSDEPARPELTFLEHALGGLAPRPARLDRDAILFRAGQAAAPRRWLWPCATAVSTTVALVLAVLLAQRPQPTTIERIVPVPAPEPTAVEKPQAPEPEPAPETPEVPDWWTARRASWSTSCARGSTAWATSLPSRSRHLDRTSL